MLLTNPVQALRDINLGRYEILACEPLHDVKGHLHNLLDELPHILPAGEVSTEINTLLKSTLSKDKITCADLRKTVIQAFLILSDLSVPEEVLLLLQTIVKIREILYSKAQLRSARTILQLYNHCWLHHELCVKLLSNPKTITKQKMFGHYIHALTAHAPTQFEITCMKSLNAENQERLFGQARQIAKKCTNHQPQNVIPQIILRLQAKQVVRAKY